MKKEPSELLLLDVNVLLALAWPNHQFHSAAVHALDRSTARWATCALTQLGFVRLSSNPAAIPGAKTPAEAASLLAAMVRDPLHVYIDSLPSPVECRAEFERILGTKQVTDAYLLALARRNHAVLATFDSRLRGLAEAGTDVRVLGACAPEPAVYSNTSREPGISNVTL